MGLIILAAVTLAYCMAGRRLERTMLTGPMIFIALGGVLGTSGALDLPHAHDLLHLVAEIALILLLFLDAAKIDLTKLRVAHRWPLRMLLLGMPLAFVLGSAAFVLILPDWPVVLAVLAAAVLMPTDAALGQAVVANRDVPIRPRRALTVESGLNDGLALPVILLLAAMAESVIAPNGAEWAVFAAKQLILGPAVGVAMGLAGGRVLIRAKDAHATSLAYEGVGAIALATGTYLVAAQVGGNGFIAAFVGGLGFGHVVKGRCPFVFEFTENEGQLLAWGAFFLLGFALVPEAIAHLGTRELVAILVSLFLVRPAAIWLSLIGTRAAPVTRLFFGWFGPRGLATALFALLVVPQLGPDRGEAVLYLAINAVWISALLHGMSAAPLARAYATRVAKMGDCAESAEIEASAKPLPGLPAAPPRA